MVSFDLEPDERVRIATELVQPLVEAWAGMPLVHTSFYGIREYHRGAELRMHVDRVATHVFSVIINVDQVGVDEPWPLELIDFEGKRSSVVMEPGQLLFYQSAKLVHGRPASFNGTRYSNCFCHFSPVEGWDYVYGAGDILYHRGEPAVDYKVYEHS
jgi:prolyl 4-hydroxylase